MLLEEQLTKLKVNARLIFLKVINKLGLSEDIFYVGSSEALPPPLSQDEEGHLLKRSKLVTTRLSVLIERNLRLVVYIAIKLKILVLALKIWYPLEQ